VRVRRQANRLLRALASARPPAAATAVAVLAVAIVVAGCGGSAAATISPAARPPTPTPELTASLTPTTMPSGSAAPLDLPSVPPGALLLVGIGDSIPGAGDHDNPPTYACTCDSYVTIYGELAAADLGRPVVVANLATNDGVQSWKLLERVRGEARYRTALAAADLITVTIGTNDWQGPCGWPAESCWSTGLATVPAKVGAILDEIVSLRAGRPTAIRLTTYFDPYIEWPGNVLTGDPNGSTPTAFLEFYRLEQAKFYGALCDQAERRGVICVDLWTPFNAPAHDQPATPLLLADHVHPNQDGHRLIAETVAEAGFGELE
jgi:lysophospholipase L1-like esterase